MLDDAVEGCFVLEDAAALSSRAAAPSRVDARGPRASRPSPASGGVRVLGSGHSKRSVVIAHRLNFYFLEDL